MRQIERCVLALALVFPACGGGDAGPGSWAGSIDTLRGGAVLVSNPATAIWDSASAWRLVEDLRIGSVDAMGPTMFGSVAGVQVDVAGRIYVLDRQAKEVRVFDAMGSHLRTLGREGGGPGELKDPIGLALEPESQSLWVVDPANARYTVYDTAGAFLTSYRRASGGYSVPFKGGFDPGGMFYEGTFTRVDDEFQHALIGYERGEGTLSPRDTFRLPEYDEETFDLTSEAGFISANVPFSPQQIWTFGSDGHVWLGVSGEYRIHKLGLDGDTLLVVQREHVPLPVTAEEREQALERLEWFTRQGGKVDPSRIPDRKPVFTGLWVAPSGHLWVVRTRPAGAGGARLDVFDPRGRYLGEVRMPTSLRYPVFAGDALYGVTSDDLGVQYVVRLRIER